jgi:plasmid maintenance system antidote protein VapI
MAQLTNVTQEQLEALPEIARPLVETLVKERDDLALKLTDVMGRLQKMEKALQDHVRRRLAAVLPHALSEALQDSRGYHQSVLTRRCCPLT